MRDETVIKAIQNGDESAINDTITQYSKLLWSIASAILKNVASTQDIEECVADVFIYLWKNPDKYDPQRGRLKVWLSVVAKSQAINKYRELSKHGSAPLEDTLFVDQVGIADEVIAEETKKLLLTAIRALEEPDKEILIRRYYYQQKPKEIAFALDMPAKGVENHLYRTKRKLRDMIGRL